MPGRRIGNRFAFDVDAAYVKVHFAHLSETIESAHFRVSPEENVEFRFIQSNDSTDAVCCFDRQIQMPDTLRTLNLTWLAAGNLTALIAIEMKHYPDRRIQGVHGKP